jgi:hypothetical protein
MLKIIILAAFAVIVYNLVAGGYYMLTDQSKSDRVVRALTWRIGISIGLFASIGFAIYMGWIQPNEVKF